MAFKCEEVEKNLSKLTFEVSSEDFKKAIDRAYNKNKGKFEVPVSERVRYPRQ